MPTFTIGADIGGTKKAYGLFDGERKLVDALTLPSDPALSPERFFDGVVADIDRLLETNGASRGQLRGVGIAMPSFILFEQGRIVLTSALPKIEDFAARDYLRERMGAHLPIFLDNDAKAAALAEYRYGAGRGSRHMLYCPVSTGISSGIIIDGKLFRGSYGWAGESGHTLITPGAGIECGCKNRGCFMSYASGKYIVEHIREWIAAGEHTVMVELAGGAGQITAQHVRQAFEAGDAMAVRAVEQMAQYLGVFLFNLFLVLNINCYVFGGGLVHFGAPLFDRVRAVFAGYSHIDVPVHFHFAQLGKDSGMIGANELLFPDRADA